jgi:metal-responsive CopG/Arc/MetJ family transcriptional regulator
MVQPTKSAKKTARLELRTDENFIQKLESLATVGKSSRAEIIREAVDCYEMLTQEEKNNIKLRRIRETQVRSK